MENRLDEISHKISTFTVRDSIDIKCFQLSFLSKHSEINAILSFKEYLTGHRRELLIATCKDLKEQAEIKYNQILNEYGKEKDNRRPNHRGIPLKDWTAYKH